jgi:hypothetical protein
MVVSGQLHDAPVALLLGKQLPIPIGYKAVWGSERAGGGGEEKKHPATVGNRTQLV